MFICVAEFGLSLAIIKTWCQKFPGSPVLGNSLAFTARVQSLVRELRSCKLWGEANKKKKERKIKLGVKVVPIQEI